MDESTTSRKLTRVERIALTAVFQGVTEARRQLQAAEQAAQELMDEMGLDRSKIYTLSPDGSLSIADTDPRSPEPSA